MSSHNFPNSEALPSTESFLKMRQDAYQILDEPRFNKYKVALEQLPMVDGKISLDLHKSTLKVFSDISLEPNQIEKLTKSLKVFCPWKKGPFDLFGINIDGEWRSDLKWQRLLDYGVDLDSKVVCDVGANNGYFMLRMADLNPKLVLGLEPYQKHWFNFDLLNKYFDQSNLVMEPYGVEELIHFPKFFDTIFCLGILYHRSDPVACLRQMSSALAKGGEIYIDCMGIEGQESVSFVPAGKYAGASGVWNLPTQMCLENWFKRTGFAKIDCIFAEPLSTEEQRSTDWAQVDSLGEFLNKKNKAKTIEGYPAPWRFYYKIKK